MFGGYGIYKDGVMFGLVAWDRFFLRVDAESLPEFEKHGCERFVYETEGRAPVSMSYYEPPEVAMTSSIKMKPWSILGWQAALRVSAAKPARRVSRRKG
jgi:DNA transformation protein